LLPPIRLGGEVLQLNLHPFGVSKELQQLSAGSLL
jgi:hypothetical protein